MSETVHVKVIRGSVSAVFLPDKYEKGDVIETTREIAEKIDPNFIIILEDAPTEPVEAEPAEEVIPESLEPPEPPEANVEDAEDEPEKASVEVAEVGEVEESKPKRTRKKATADA